MTDVGALAAFVMVLMRPKGCRARPMIYRYALNPFGIKVELLAWLKDAHVVFSFRES